MDIAILLALVVIIALQIATIVMTKKPPMYISSMNREEAESIIKKMESGKVVAVHPRGRGSIYIPPSDVETVREKIIEENSAKGIDTPISQLQ